MPGDHAFSLGRLHLPAFGEMARFSYSGHRYLLRGELAHWSLQRDDGAVDLGTLARTPSGWAMTASAEPAEWHDQLHFLAIAAFLDDTEPVETDSTAA